MKKLLIALMITVMAIVFSLTASATGYDAFSGEIKTNANTECHDAGGSKQMGWFVDETKGENFGIGNTEPGDYVVFPQVNFGTTGASKASIRFSFLVTDVSPLPCNMEMYIDSVSGSPVATFSIEDTGHWIEEASMNFNSNCSIPAGVHDVFVKWKDNTGSLFGISFTKASGSGSGDSNNTTVTNSNSQKDTGATNASSKVGVTTSENESSKADTNNTDSTVSTDSTQTTVSDNNTSEDLTGNNSESLYENKQNGTNTKETKSNKGLIITVIIIAIIVVAGGVSALVIINKKKDPEDSNKDLSDKNDNSDNKE